ncbi:MAG TPA: hypothetical protein VEH77_15845 [Roseiarcus sp.]|nr:hypothetical protein [Roseiarcus sp.]
MLKITSLLLTVGLLSLPAAALAQDYPILDKIAQKVVQKYQTSSCEQLKAEKEKPPSAQREEMEQRAIGMLRSDAQMRRAFLDKVAAPIADKLLECGMIP